MRPCGEIKDGVGSVGRLDSELRLQPGLPKMLGEARSIYAHGTEPIPLHSDPFHLIPTILLQLLFPPPLDRRPRR